MRPNKGEPTGKLEMQVIEKGELGYLKWLAEKHPQQFAPLYGRLVPLEMNLKTDQPKKRVVYPSLDETRAALRARGIDPDIIQAAMMPKFLTDQSPVIDAKAEDEVEVESNNEVTDAT